MNPENNIVQKAQAIRLLLLDVDGVLTDGRLYFSNSGDQCKAFHTLDGHGLKMLQQSGVQVGIITGRRSELLAKRAEDLGITLLVQGREDKLTALEELLREQSPLIKCENISFENIAFMGDDWPDLPVMLKVGLALTVINAHEEVVQRAHWCSRRQGGEGAVREACDWLMQAQGTFTHALQQYL